MTGDSLTTAPALLALLVLVAVVTVVMALVTDDRDPSIVLAWLFVIVLVPVLGVVAYFFLGRNHRERARRRATWRTAVQEPTRDRLEPQPAARRAGSEAAVDGHASPAHRIEATALYEGGTVPLASTSVRLYFTGAEKFRDLFADLRGARQSIHLMYLIWERDELTARSPRSCSNAWRLECVST